MKFILIMLIGLVLWAIFLFNRLVRDRNLVRAGWSDIDVQLKRRYDLVPRLVEAVKGYARYERATLQALIALRSHSATIDDIAARGALEGQLGHGLSRLIMLAEAYPDLKANDNFIQLQRKLIDVEDQLQFARRFYNGCVRNFNTRIEAFPDLLIAIPFQFRPAAFFELDDPLQQRSPEVVL